MLCTNQGFDLDETLANSMPYFSIFGRLKLDWPLYNGKAALLILPAGAICAYLK